MPTYEYECSSCGKRIARQQAISEKALTQCPECGGQVTRLISGGVGFILKGGGGDTSRRKTGGCSLETTGRTCCGRDQRCGKPSCDE
ncbi:MAG: zinc ribbon domain-containing protein [Candidatus Edwardsbacteria bacterium]|nr:zinc ribbon domain-containing protein [Candidatus Edwardsbacteria bacterium]